MKKFILISFLFSILFFRIVAAQQILEITETLERIGFFSFFIPFLIVFALFYGLLSKSQVFGAPDDKVAKGANFILSISAAFIIVANTPLGVTMQVFFNRFFGLSSAILLVLILSILIVALFGGRQTLENILQNKPRAASLFLILSLGIFGFLALNSVGRPDVVTLEQIDFNTILPILFTIGIFLGLGFYFLGGRREEEERGQQKQA